MQKKPLEDENPRQLSLDLWWKIYLQHTVKTEEEWVDYILEYDVSLTMEVIDLNAQFEAGCVARRGTELSLPTLRKLVWERDEGVCQVCLKEIPYSDYQCGHMVDWALGGSNRLTNLVAMCGVCNQTKPMTSTKEAYWRWVQMRRRMRKRQLERDIN